MPIHVAILKRPYVRLILSGEKTVESRLTRTAQPPLRTITTGERIFIKASSGPFMATALAGQIDQHEALELRDVLELRDRYNNAVCGNDEYWEVKKHSRFGVFIHLQQVEPIEVGPVYPKSMRAWHVLDESLSPLKDVTLTDGAIRNRYISLIDTTEKMRRRPVTLLLPDGQEVQTAFAEGKAMLKWRGWGAYYGEHRMNPGDAVRFVALSPGRYRVTFRKQVR